MFVHRDFQTPKRARPPRETGRGRRRRGPGFQGGVEPRGKHPGHLRLCDLRRNGGRRLRLHAAQRGADHPRGKLVGDHRGAGARRFAQRGQRDPDAIARVTTSSLARTKTYGRPLNLAVFLTRRAPWPTGRDPPRDLDPGCMDDQLRARLLVSTCYETWSTWTRAGTDGVASPVDDTQVA